MRRTKMFFKKTVGAALERAEEFYLSYLRETLKTGLFFEQFYDWLPLYKILYPRFHDELTIFKSGVEALEEFLILKGYNSAAPIQVELDDNTNFWVCFACLSDACTFFADIIEGRYFGRPITDINQCHMYRKFKYFLEQIN